MKVIIIQSWKETVGRIEEVGSNINFNPNFDHDKDKIGNISVGISNKYLTSLSKLLELP